MGRKKVERKKKSEKQNIRKHIEGKRHRVEH